MRSRRAARPTSPSSTPSGCRSSRPRLPPPARGRRRGVGALGARRRLPRAGRRGKPVPGQDLRCLRIRGRRGSVVLQGRASAGWRRAADDLERAAVSRARHGGRPDPPPDRDAGRLARRRDHCLLPDCSPRRQRRARPRCRRRYRGEPRRRGHAALRAPARRRRAHAGRRGRLRVERRGPPARRRGGRPSRSAGATRRPCSHRSSACR